jgi:hypothetical protein
MAEVFGLLQSRAKAQHFISACRSLIRNSKFVIQNLKITKNDDLSQNNSIHPVLVPVRNPCSPDTPS